MSKKTTKKSAVKASAKTSAKIKVKAKVIKIKADKQLTKKDFLVGKKTTAEKLNSLKDYFKYMAAVVDSKANTIQGKADVFRAKAAMYMENAKNPKLGGSKKSPKERAIAKLDRMKVQQEKLLKQIAEMG